MENRSNYFRRDLLKVSLILVVIFLLGLVFFFTPGLSTPTLVSIVLAAVASPLVSMMERKGFPRVGSIVFIFTLVFTGLAILGFWISKNILTEWHSFSSQLSTYFDQVVDRIGNMQSRLQTTYPFLMNFNPTLTLTEWGVSTKTWFMQNAPKILSDAAAWLFLVPILTFFLLKDGRSFMKRFYSLVPNRYFESTFMVTTKIFNNLSNYVSAKLAEGFIVGVLVTIGLWIVGSPYFVLLGVIAGITNIVPYLGPVIGAIPGLFIVFLDPSLVTITFPVFCVYLIANVVDMVFIFPVVVAKMVNLHPVMLVIAVIVGQQYYGLIGMLLSIPIATTLKVIFQEVYDLVYERSRIRLKFPTESEEAN